MTSDRTWNLGALARFCTSVILSAIIAGPILATLADFFTAPHRRIPWHFLGYNLGALACLVAGLVILQMPWRLERFLRNLIAVFVTVYAALFLLWLASRASTGYVADPGLSTSRIVAAVLSFQAAALVFAHCFLRQHAIGWREAFGLDSNPKNALLLGLAVGMVAVPVGGGLQMLSGLTMKALHITAHEQEAVQALRGAGGVWNHVVLGITAIILAPVAEETLFRGILYSAIKQIGYPRVAVIVTSLLFGVIHANVATLIPLAVLAVALVWAYEKTGNLLASITAHSVFNLINFIMLFVDERLLHMPVNK